MFPNMEIHKKVVVDDAGTPQEVIIPWAEFQQIQEILGLDEEIELSPEWETELGRRIADIDAGRVELVSSEDVFEHVESALKKA
jgi:PHD/YefM family antitoxin component YafN of YafNO toxin-antitoxin module